MFRNHRCVYFDCSQVDEKDIPFNKLVNKIGEAVKKYNIEYALNKLTTVNDLVFYKAVEAYKCQGGQIKNVYMKFEGWPPRKFDESFKLILDKSIPLDTHLESFSDVVIRFHNGVLKLSEITR